MKLGSRAVLFGIHQPLLHGVAVWLAWVRVYRSLPTLPETLAIFCHDVGYFGKGDLDGAEGTKHPELGARIAEWLAGAGARDLVLGHSRSYAELVGIPISALCVPDKLAVLTTPAWLYTALGVLSGELDEFQAAVGLGRSDRHLVVHVFRVAAYEWALSHAATPSLSARIATSFGPAVLESRARLSAPIASKPATYSS